MPFLRVLRDKRGYETTYLMHWFRDGSRQRSRILYMFRTPPGVRVGRAFLDAAVMRELEAQYPDIDFEWDTLVENQQVLEVAPEPRRPRPSTRSARTEAVEGRKKRREESTEPVAAVTEMPAGDQVPQQVDVTPPAAAESRKAVALRRMPVPAAVEGETPEEKIAWLQAWYPQIRDRIPHRTHDPVRREALLALCERLNPGGWTDADQITAGLASAAEALQRLSRVFSKRRRRSRRRAAGSRMDGAEQSNLATSEPDVPAEPVEPASRGPSGSSGSSGS